MTYSGHKDLIHYSKIEIQSLSYQSGENGLETTIKSHAMRMWELSVAADSEGSECEDSSRHSLKQDLGGLSLPTQNVQRQEQEICVQYTRRSNSSLNSQIQNRAQFQAGTPREY